MRPWRWRLSVLVGFVVAGSLIVIGGAASADGPVCGETVTESVVLTADLTCSGDGLRVEGENITIDLNGHTISGSGVGNGMRMNPATALSTTVMNGKIRGFGRGVSFAFGFFGPAAEFLTLTHLNVSSNGTGVYIDIASAGFILIEDSVISNNGGPGIFAKESEFLRVRRNTISDNGTEGINSFYSVDGALYEDNLIARNGWNGIYVQRGTSQVIGNTVIGNGHEGTEGNNNGIVVLSEQQGQYRRYLISHNRADKNAGYGIIQLGSDPSGCQGPIPCDPRPGGMPDPMSNTAKHNGNPAQCLNITCTRN